MTEVCTKCGEPKGKHLCVRSIDRDYASQEWLMCPNGLYEAHDPLLRTINRMAGELRGCVLSRHHLEALLEVIVPAMKPEDVNAWLAEVVAAKITSK